MIANTSGYDLYNRVVATLICAGTNVNARMVAAGMAYNEGGVYAREEEEARRARRGVHSSGSAVRPKDFRRGTT